MKEILSIELVGLVITFIGWLTGIKPIQLIGALLVIAVTAFIIYEMEQKERRRQEKERRMRNAGNPKRNPESRARLY